MLLGEPGFALTRAVLQLGQKFERLAVQRLRPHGGRHCLRLRQHLRRRRFEGPKGVLKGLFEHHLRLTREALISTSPTTYTSPLPDGRT